MIIQRILFLGSLFVGYSFCSFLSPLHSSLRILVVPANHKSHGNLFAVAGEILQTRGHDVVMLTHPRFHDMLNSKGLKYFGFNSTVTLTPEDLIVQQTDNYKLSPTSMFNVISIIHSEILVPGIQDIMSDISLQQQIAAYKFDVAILDNTVDRFLSVIPYKHGIPYICLGPLTMSFQLGIPALTSIEPLAVAPFTDVMSFWERLQNFVFTVLIELVFPPNWRFITDVDPDTIIHKYLGDSDKPILSLSELYLNSRMWFANWDIAAMGYPKVAPPYVRYLTGLNARKPRPLGGPLKETVDGIHADDSIIVFSMGSLFREIPHHRLQNFLAAFGRLKESVFVAYKGDPPKDVPKNVYMERWLPQNDLLGHPKTKLFITHGGNNGALEALYHGIPMICFPMGSDQTNNAIRAQYRGFGIRLDFHTFTADELYETIQELLTNKSYSENMKRASRIYHGLPSAADEFVFWTEHVAEFGSDHLRSRALTMPWYQLFMVDVFVLFMVVVHVAIFVSICCCKFCYRKCCGKKTGTKDKKKTE